VPSHFAELFCGVPVLFGMCGPALSEGFAIKHQSGTGEGIAYAGTAATAHDASAVFFNPAALTQLQGNQFVGIANFIVPVTKLKRSAGTLPAALGGGPAGGVSTADDAGLDAIVPVAYASWSVGKAVRLGIGVNSPWGLATDYDEGWQGRFKGVTSKLKTVNVTPAAAYRVADWLSVGAGVQVQYADVRLTNAILTTTGEGFIDLAGDDVGVGWTAGFVVEPRKGSRLGVGYRSEIDQTFTGTARLAPGVGPSMDLDFRGDLTFPETVRIGVSQDLPSGFAVHFGAVWRRWSRVEQQQAVFETPVAALAGARDVTVRLDWANTWFFSAGLTYTPTPGWMLRAGIGFDESPIPDKTREPRIPGADGKAIAFGGSYRVTDAVDLTFAYTHVFVDDSSINLADPLSGALTAQYESHIDTFVVQARVQF